MRYPFDNFRIALQRAPEQESKKCSFGKYPRHDKTARRQDDCTIDCADYAACEKANMKDTLDDPD